MNSSQKLTYTFDNIYSLPEPKAKIKIPTLSDLNRYKKRTEVQYQFQQLIQQDKKDFKYLDIQTVQSIPSPSKQAELEDKVICRYWRHLFYCAKGAEYIFAHDDQNPTKFRTAMCKYSSDCKYKNICVQAHSISELRLPISNNQL